MESSEKPLPLLKSSNPPPFFEGMEPTPKPMYGCGVDFFLHKWVFWSLLQKVGPFLCF